VRFYVLDTRGLNKGSAGSDVLSAEATSQPEMSRPTWATRTSMPQTVWLSTRAVSTSATKRLRRGAPGHRPRHEQLLRRGLPVEPAPGRQVPLAVSEGWTGGCRGPGRRGTWPRRNSPVTEARPIEAPEAPATDAPAPAKAAPHLLNPSSPAEMVKNVASWRTASSSSLLRGDCRETSRVADDGWEGIQRASLRRRSRSFCR